MYLVMDFPLQGERETPRGTEVWYPIFELRIHSDRELEQRIGIDYLLLDEHRDLLRIGYSHITAHFPQAPCSSTFAGIRVWSVSRFGFRENSTLLVILRSAVEVKNAMPMAVLLN